MSGSKVPQLDLVDRILQVAEKKAMENLRCQQIPKNKETIITILDEEDGPYQDAPLIVQERILTVAEIQKREEENQKKTKLDSEMTEPEKMEKHEAAQKAAKLAHEHAMMRGDQDDMKILTGDSCIPKPPSKKREEASSTPLGKALSLIAFTTVDTGADTEKKAGPAASGADTEKKAGPATSGADTDASKKKAPTKKKACKKKADTENKAGKKARKNQEPEGPSKPETPTHTAGSGAGPAPSEGHKMTKEHEAAESLAALAAGPAAAGPAAAGPATRSLRPRPRS